MHYRAILKAEAFPSFPMWERNVNSLYNKEKGWIDSMYAVFNLTRTTILSETRAKFWPKNVSLMSETERDDNQADRSDKNWTINERERSETFVPPWKKSEKEPTKFGP